jgi:fatty-acyl-CoA synthase
MSIDTRPLAQRSVARQSASLDENATDAPSVASLVAYEPADTREPVLDITIGNALRAAAARWPDRPALIEGLPKPALRRRWTFAQALQEAENVGRALASRFRPGEHVAIWAANLPEWFFAEFGAALAGITLVTVNPAYLAPELAHVLKQSRACGVIVQDHYRGRDLLAAVAAARETLPLLREVIPLSAWREFAASGAREIALPTVLPGDVAQIQYTSGTTGAPKGARLTHRGLANNSRFYARTVGARETDTWVNPMPMFHTAGCSLCTLGALQTGGAQVMPPGFDAELMLDCLEQERGTIVLCVPTMLHRMLDAASIATRDLSSWRLVSLGGAPIAPELVRRAEQRGVKAVIGYGETEASPYLTHTAPDDPDPERVGTVGRPLPQTEIKIVNPETGEILPRGAIGEICARGYGIMKDYFDNPAGTAAAIDAEGWLRTGDLGSLDARGYCRVQGRAKDMIIRGGENIYPREIEDVLHTHPAILGASVVGVPDADWGEIPVAFVQAKPDARPSAAELEAFCRERLASYKVPRVWRFVDQFPLTASGKIQKFLLREQLSLG